MLKKIEGVRGAKYHGCRWCWVPQKICQRWESSVGPTGQPGFTFVGSAPCQFDGVLRNAVAVAISERPKVRDWLYQEAGGRSEQGSDKLEEEWYICEQWLGKKFRESGMEMSGICKLFEKWC